MGSVNKLPVPTLLLVIEVSWTKLLFKGSNGQIISRRPHGSAHERGHRNYCEHKEKHCGEQQSDARKGNHK